ncbi:MAG: deoxyribonuclease IV [Butyrivibrio sp.]
MLTIGCHLSVSKGFLHMGKEAVSIGADTFQFFSRNPRGGNVKTTDPEDKEAYITYAAETGIKTVLAHAPYTLNPCSKDEGLREFAQNTMSDDLRRLSWVPGCMYNFHPGSHVGQGSETGIILISDLLNRVLDKDDGNIKVLLETMAGKGSEVGKRFEEIKAIIDKVERKDRIGVCLDTCHVYDAGYDIVNEPEKVLEEFDEIIGLDRLSALHINDSLFGLGSHKDRHAAIGEGRIGTEAFERFINIPLLKGLPCYLETPNELPGYAKEIALLKSLYTLD